MLRIRFSKCPVDGGLNVSERGVPDTVLGSLLNCSPQRRYCCGWLAGRLVIWQRGRDQAIQNEGTSQAVAVNRSASDSAQEACGHCFGTPINRGIDVPQGAEILGVKVGENGFRIEPGNENARAKHFGLVAYTDDERVVQEPAAEAERT